MRVTTTNCRPINAPAEEPTITWKFSHPEIGVMAVPREAGRSDAASGNLGDDGNVELGIVLLHVVGAVLGAEFLDHGRDMFGVSDRSCLDFSFCAARIDVNGRVLEDVFVPLGV